jgi:hypothetical protein
MFANRWRAGAAAGPGCGGRDRRGRVSSTWTFGMLASAVLLGALGCATAPAAAPSPVPPPVPSVPAAAAPPAATAPQREVSAADLADHIGDSIETAVLVPIDVPNEGVDFQNRWIFDHFGRFRRKAFAMGHAPGASGHERHYDIITVELPDGSVHEVFFDMTEFWTNVKPK